MMSKAEIDALRCERDMLRAEAVDLWRVVAAARRLLVDGEGSVDKRLGVLGLELEAAFELLERRSTQAIQEKK
jgi:hypothetical protein